MSLSSLARMKVQRDRPAEKPVFRGEGVVQGLQPPTDDEGKKSISDALSAVAAYVPTEVIAMYTLVIGMLVSDKGADPSKPASPPHLPLWGYLAFLGAIPVLTWLLYTARLREGAPKAKIPWSPKQWPWWEIASAIIAFTAWSAALPKSAFLGWSWFTAPIASIALVGVSLVLPVIGVVVTGKPAEE